jgi:quercetin dioxygenase-like cupin family protein
MPSQPTPVPPDDLSRNLTVARPDNDQSLPHIGLVGDTYTILVTGEDTAGKYTLIDMHVPPGGGPPPHRHDFEEMFTVLDGEVQVTFRGETLIARAGETINVPAKPAEIECRGDHRIAMSFSITGLRTPGLTLDDPGCVRKTFPGFHAVLGDLRREWGLDERRSPVPS